MLRAVTLHTLPRWFVLSVLLLALCFPHVSFGWLAWIAVVPLLVDLQKSQSYKQAFLIGALFGYLFLFCAVYWLKEVIWFAMPMVPLLYVPFFGLWAVGARYLIREHLEKRPLLLCLLLPAAWTVLEWARTEVPDIGLGWHLLAYTQAPQPLLTQAANLAGAYGVSFLICAVNTAVFLALEMRRRRERYRLLALGLLIFLLNLCYGGFSLMRWNEKPEWFRAGVVQANISQAEKWQPELKELVLEKHMKLSEIMGNEKPDVVIWPEAAYPDFLNEEINATPIPALARSMRTPFLIGSLRREAGEKYYNSVFLINKQGSIAGSYDKIKLVPFGEYIPFGPLFNIFRPYAHAMGVSDFAFGKEHTVFSIPAKNGSRNISASVLICFEDIFPGVAREFVKRGAELLVVITNDAWFGVSPAAQQHFNAAVFRALENGVPVVRAANTGVSGFIAANGEIEDIFKNQNGRPIFTTGTLNRPMALLKKTTFYQKGGWLFPQFCLILLAFMAYVTRRK